jgi:glutamate carboxypeptidase
VDLSNFWRMQNTAQLKGLLEAHLPQGWEMLRQMVGINSFTGNPIGVNRLGRFTASQFEPLGFAAEFIPSTNPAWGDHLMMNRKGKSPITLALISHLDTVFPPEEEERNNFHWQIEGDRIYGPGTSDIKGGTMMMWLVLKALREFAPDVFEAVNWQLCWNSSEEQFSEDFGALCRSSFTSQTLAALVFEGEGRRNGKPLVVLARKGRAEWRVKVSGRAAHAGGKHPYGANAIVQLSETVRRIAALTDYTQNLTFTVGRIAGGTVLNRVPHEAAAEGEFRAFAPEVFQKAKSDLLSLCGPGTVQSPTDGFRCSVDVRVVSEGRPWPRNPQTDRLFQIWEDAASSLGMSVDFEERGGVSDGNFLWDAVPTLDGLGPYGDNDHCSERSADGSKVPEFIEISAFLPKALWNVQAICRLVQSAQ